MGYGNIGSQLSVLAESLGMKVYYYDLSEKMALGNAQKCNSLDELLKNSDILSIHVDGRPENTNLISKQQINKMKDGSYLINYSRGQVVNLDNVKEALEKGKLDGAVIDVFPVEPKNNQESFDCPLIGLPNVILTPHIGGSTQEVQENIGRFVPIQIINFLKHGETTLSVNFPKLTPMNNNFNARFLHIHVNQPDMLAQINSILGDNQINIEAQELRTNELIGCVLADINQPLNTKILEKSQRIPSTLHVYPLPSL